MTDENAVRSVLRSPQPPPLAPTSPESRCDLEALIDGVDAVLWEADWPSWRYTYVSRRAENLLGFPRRLWLEDSHFWMKHLHPDDRTAAVAFSLGNTERARDHEHEFRMIRADGSVVWMREVVRITRNELGRTVKLRGIMSDITDHKNKVRALRLSEQRYRALYDENPLMFLSVNTNGVIESVNDFGAQQLGYKVHELIGVRVADLHTAEEGRRIHSEFQACAESPDRVHQWETCLMRKDGKPMWARVSARAVDSEPGRRTLLVLCEDVTQARERSRELAYQAKHDPLTGLVNRAEFERRVQHALYDSHEYGREHVLCVLDIDQFKVLNYCYGHAAGDELLREMAEIVTDGLRPTDTVGRVGGDEFGLLLQDCSVDRAREVAAELLTVIAAHDFEWADNSIAITASVSLVPVRASSDSVAELMSTADTACRAAAEKGRSRIHVAHADDQEVADRQRQMEWAAQIESALLEDRFQLHFQPITPVGIIDAAATHFELLLRLRDRDDRLISPNQFLPAAERYQLSARIDRWVVAHAVRWLKLRPANEVARETWCINLSGPTLADSEFLQFALEQFSGAELCARAVCFEITETAVIGNLTRATQCMHALKRAGCRFALDDFGSGLSSFAYLKTLPVDYLKIDGVFVRNIAADSTDLSFLRLINELGHLTGKKTIAEFVESEETLSKLREVGVDFAQGFHIAQPKPLQTYADTSRTAGDAESGGATPAAVAPNISVFSRKRPAPAR